MSHAEIPSFHNPFEQTRNAAVRAEIIIGRFTDRAMTRMGLPEDPQLRRLVAFGLLTSPIFIVGTTAVLVAGRIS